MPFSANPRSTKPVLRKLIPAIGHIFAAENTHFQQLLWCQFRQKSRVKIFPGRFNQVVHVVFLHPIIDDYFSHTFHRIGLDPALA